MGSGFKDFAAGDILTAADVDGYLMRQTVMTFADASARDSALSGVLDEGMMAYLEDTNRTTYYDGSAWQDIAKSSSIGTWTAYTPTLGGLTLNNGTVDFAYARVNDVVNVMGRMTIGSTTTFSGNFTFSLPVTAVATTVGMAYYGRAVFPGVAVYSLGLEYSNTTTMAVNVIDTAGAYATHAAANNGTPGIWNSGYWYEFTMTYRAA